MSPSVPTTQPSDVLTKRTDEERVVAVVITELNESRKPGPWVEGRVGPVRREAPRSMTVVGTSIKTLFLLLVLVRRRGVGLGVGHAAGPGRSRRRLREHDGHDPRRVLAGQLRRVLRRHLPRRQPPPGRAARRRVRDPRRATASARSRPTFDAQTDGIVAAAILSTLAVFVVALFLYVTRIVKPTQKLAVRRDRRDRRPVAAVPVRVGAVDLQLGLPVLRRSSAPSGSS